MNTSYPPVDTALITVQCVEDLRVVLHICFSLSNLFTTCSIYQMRREKEKDESLNMSYLL